MINVVFVMDNSKLAKKKQTRKPTQINKSSDDEWIMEDEHEHTETFDLDENFLSK